MKTGRLYSVCVAICLLGGIHSLAQKPAPPTLSDGMYDSIAGEMHSRSAAFVPSIVSNDYLYWNGEKYLVNLSPLHAFREYRSLYPEMPTVKFGMRTGTRGVEDKNYAAVWLLRNDSLFLVRLDFEPYYSDYKVYPPKEKDPNIPSLDTLYGRMERMLKTSFGPRDDLAAGDSLKVIGSYGVIPAVWVNGRVIVRGCYRFCGSVQKWDRTTPFKVLSFQDGKLMSVKKVKNKLPVYVAHP